MTDKFTFTVDEAVEFSKIGRTTLYKALGSGELVARKFGKRTVILRQDLENWMIGLPAYQVGKAPESIWTAESISHVAKSYDSRSSFASGARKAYDAARKLGVLDEVCSHMNVWKRKKLPLVGAAPAEVRGNIKDALMPPHKPSTANGNRVRVLENLILNSVGCSAPSPMQLIEVRRIAVLTNAMEEMEASDEPLDAMQYSELANTVRRLTADLISSVRS